MAKYLSNVGGTATEVSGLVTSTGVSDAGKIVQLDGSGRLDATVMPVGIGAETVAIVASENLAAGNLVNIWNNSGTANVRKADASNGRIAHGFVLSSVASAATATVYMEGAVTGLTGLTIGAKLFLSATTPGTVTSTAPTTAAQTVQQVGYATSATSFTFSPMPEIVLA